ncbi:hypothetical protein RRG08_030443 [Elysia crispata]|uniref:Uncharacterized protein n=1 Tax=Elysia crispata TaxID=231223 RepID=A0AAE1B1M8_9GAST|nr:hypothetical protein RRG08_030443 [Elysia crispata]
MADFDCGDCDCGDCDCGNCNCDCDDCCDCCPSIKDCNGCCCFASSYTCGQCLSDILEFVCCENSSSFNSSTNRSNGFSSNQHHQQRQLQQPPYHETADECTPCNENFKPLEHPSAPPPSYDEVVLSQPLPTGFEPAITSQPGFNIDPPSSRI